MYIESALMSKSRNIALKCTDPHFAAIPYFMVTRQKYTSPFSQFDKIKYTTNFKFTFGLMLDLAKPSH